jgi:tRNA (guanine37-N1)-methyltransferase
MKKRIWVLGLFEEFFVPLKNCGIAGQVFRGTRGVEIELCFVNLRHYSPDDYKGVDDAPYGGGPGMVLRADILARALKEGVLIPSGHEDLKKSFHIIATHARGGVFNHQKARELALEYLGPTSERELVFLAGRYEGYDERFLEKYVDEFLSLGDFILTGGEIAVMAMVDATVRFTPNALGNKLSSTDESFEDGLLEHPHYTRPALFEGMKVPATLMSGHHGQIETYRIQEKERLTQKFRPDLWQRYLNKDQR